MSNSKIVASTLLPHSEEGMLHAQEYHGDPDNRQEVRAWRVAHTQAAQEVAAAQKAWERQKKAAAKAAKQKAAQV